MTLGILGIGTVVGNIIEKTLGYPSVPLAYLATIIVSSLFLSRWPVMVLASGSALAWWFFYLPHKFSLRISRYDDALMLLLFFVAAVVSGHLASRLRKRERCGVEGERTARMLNKFIISLNENRTGEGVCLDKAVAEIQKIFGTPAVLLQPSADGGRLESQAGGKLHLDEAGWSSARRAWEERRWQTADMNTAITCVPLVSGGHAWGVLAIEMPPDAWPALQRELMESVARLLAQAIESETIARQAREAQLVMDSQKMQRALVDNFSHELHTPLSVLSAAVQHLQRSALPNNDRAILQEAAVALRRLNLVVGEMVNLAQLDRGLLRPALEWCDTADFLREWMEGRAELIGHRPVKVSLPQKPLYVRLDTRLMNTALDNILQNALQHAPPGTAIELEAATDGARVNIRISDSGPGVSPAEAERIFDRFYRGTGESPGGLGLGLAVARQFVELMAGVVGVMSRPNGGASFTISLPCATELPLTGDAVMTAQRTGKTDPGQDGAMT